MKKVFQIKLKNITRVFALVIAVSLVTFTGCKSYDEDIANLETDIAALKTELTTLNTTTKAATDAQIAALTAEINTLKTKVATLESTGATDAEVAAAITAAKADIMSKVATLEAFNAYKTTNDAAIAALTTKVNAAATKAELDAVSAKANAAATKVELDAVKAELNTMISGVKTTLTALGVDVTAINVKVTGLTADVAKLTTDLGKVKGDVEARLAIIEGLLKISAGKSTVLDGFTTQLADQLAKINANTAAITALQTSLTAEKAKIVTLQADVVKDKADIAALQTSVAALQASVTKINANLKTIASAINMNFEALSSRLTSLVFAPSTSTSYVNGIEAITFGSFVYPCGSVVPTVEVTYQLNPSFITKEDIDKDNLQFVVQSTSNLITSYMGAKAANNAAGVKATFVKIEGGKIFVSVKVEDIALFAKTSSSDSYGMTETFKMIALQIPLSTKAVTENQLTFNDADGTVTVGQKTYPAAGVITAPYVRLFDKADTYTKYALARRAGSASYVFPTTEAGAKALTVANPIDGVSGGTTAASVINIPYGTNPSLMDSVMVVLNSGTYSLFNAAAYGGWKFKFDMLDANGVAINYALVSNGTNQQAFITISETGQLTQKVYDVPGFDASQNRTPIIRIRAYNGTDANGITCAVYTSWAKLNLVNKPVPPAITVIPDGIDPVNPSCADSMYAYTTVKWMNEKLYQGAAKLSKEEFHQVYKMTFVGNGKVVQDVDPNVTDSYIYRWGLSVSDIWSALMSNPSVSDHSVVVTFTPNYSPTLYPVIKFTWTRKFTVPASLNIAASKLITNYWYPQAPGTTNAISTSASTAMPYNYVKHNIVVPNVGETNNALAIFSNNINQAFEQNANKSLSGLANYEYYFIANTKTTPTSVLGDNDHSQPVMMVNGVRYQLTPSADGKSLLNGSEVVATINPFAANVGDVLTLNQASATAKLLLNAGAEFLKVRIAIRTVYCANLPQFKMPVTINGKPYMDVVFVRPINPQPAADQHFVDALNFGDQYTYLEIAKLTNLNDWRFSDPVASFATHFNYWSYYGITNITADVANIKTDLNQAAGVTVPLAQYPDLRVAYALTVPSVTNPAPTTPATFFGYLTYNNTGNTLGKLFNLYVPVTVTYSWGTIQSAQVVVPVWKTVGSAGVKAKK